MKICQIGATCEILDQPLYWKVNAKEESYCTCTSRFCSLQLTTAANINAGCSAVANVSLGDSIRVTGETSDPSIQKGHSGFVGHLVQKYI